MTPKEFEQEISRFEYALKGRRAKITWDAKIPDPDNPHQLRQVDILIEEKKEVTIVECRHHKKKQDVKWVEEIYGRKVSLEAFSAIAVSSSGFTSGAIKKAERLGVILRKFEEVTNSEISSWGVKARFGINYIKFKQFDVYPVFSTIIAPAEKATVNQFVNSDGEPWDISELFNKVAEAADETGEKRNNLTAFMNIRKDLYYCGKKLDELIIHCDFRRLTKNVWLPSICQYSSLTKSAQLNVLKSNSPFNRSEIYQTGESLYQVVDLSMAKSVDGAVFRSITINYERQVLLSGCAVIGYNGPELSLMPLRIIPIRKNSGIYNAFDGEHSVSNLILSR